MRPSTPCFEALYCGAIGMPCQDAALDRLVSVSDRRKARVRAYRAHHNNHLPKIRSAVPLEIVHVEVDGRLRDGHQIVSAV